MMRERAVAETANQRVTIQASRPLHWWMLGYLDVSLACRPGLMK